MKNIEGFIKDHREEFDSYEPGDRVWKELEKQFPATGAKPVTRKMNWRRWSVAAAIFLIITSGVYYFMQRNQQASADSITVDNIPEEYAEEVYHFTRLIDLKHKELNKIRKEEPELYQKFSSDILRLDSSFQLLKKELPGNPNEEMVLEAMVENLRIQIDLLNQQLAIIKKIKQSKNIEHAKKYKSA